MIMEDLYHMYTVWQRHHWAGYKEGISGMIISWNKQLWSTQRKRVFNLKSTGTHPR